MPCRLAPGTAIGSAGRGRILLALRALGVANDDDEIFAASMEAAAKLSAPLYQWQWREQMVLTFPERPEVRKIAWEELHRRGGGIGAVARSYAGDAEMTTEMLRVLAPLSEMERLILAAALQAPAAADDRAARVLEEIGEDIDGAVAAEGVFGTAQALITSGAPTGAYVQGLTDALWTVGPDYEARRAAAVNALAVLGRLDGFAGATEGNGEPLRFGSEISPGRRSLPAARAAHVAGVLAGVGRRRWCSGAFGVDCGNSTAAADRGRAQRGAFIRHPLQEHGREPASGKTRPDQLTRRVRAAREGASGSSP